MLSGEQRDQICILESLSGYGVGDDAQEGPRLEAGRPGRSLPVSGEWGGGTEVAWIIQGRDDSGLDEQTSIQEIDPALP